MQRDMSYALDGAFSTRNQGQLISSTQVVRKDSRSPGLVEMQGPGVRAMPGPTAGNILPGLGQSITLPVLGSVDLKSILLGAVIIGGVLYFMRK